MLDSINNFAAANAQLIWSLVAIALGIVALSRQRVRFWVRDFWVTFPGIGSIAKLAKDTTRGNDGWMRAEEKLCAIYKPYIILMNESRFNERIEYMRKAADLGRRPTPPWVWVLLVVLVIAEGLGFSYLLGSWMAREGSANTHTLLMFAIVLVLCVILVALTHAAGHQYFRTSLLRACFRRYKDVAGKEYTSQQIALKDKQSIDDAQPDYIQCANRVAKHSHDKGSYAAGIIAILAIAFIAIASTAMRWHNLEGELIRESSQQAQMASSNNGNPFNNLVLPKEVSEPQKKADDKAVSEASKATEKEGLTAFAMLAFIFVITQIVGMGAGYKYGFVGRESGEAYRSTGTYSTYDAYWAHFEPIMDLVNARLKDLQQKMEEHSHQKLMLGKTFRDYLVEQQERSDRARGDIDRPRQPHLAPVSENEAPAATISLEQAKAEIIALADKQAQQTYYSALPSALKDELKPWLKQRKNEEATRLAAESKAREQAELTELF